EWEAQATSESILGGSAIMQVPLQIAFRNMPRSENAVQVIESYVKGLEEFYGRITSCRVVVDMPHRHHEAGNLYQVRVDLSLPGHEIIVNRETSQQTQFKDLNVALGNAFDTVGRQLEDYARQRRAQIKHHEPLPHGRVMRLPPGATYGFIETP